MIEGYIGRPGSGKSYTLTARVLRRYKQYEKVCANYEIDIPNWEPLAGPEDLLALRSERGRKVLVVLDEAHLWFPARLSMKLPASMLHRLSQTRKAGWDLWWAAQHENRVDRVIRDVTNWMWLCNSWFGEWWPGMPPIAFTAKCFEPEHFRKPKKHNNRTFRFYRPTVGAAYDTGAELVVADHVAAVRDHYTNPDGGRKIEAVK